jgi:hypothetical protein
VRLIRIGDPGASLGEFGHSVRRRLPLNSFEKPFIERLEQFFGRCHSIMLARPGAASSTWRATPVMPLHVAASTGVPDLLAVTH